VGAQREKCFVVGSESLGDTLCSTPTLKKISNSYGEKFCVATHVPEIFSNNPYVKKVVDIKSFNKNKYDIFETYYNVGKQDSKGIEKKHSVIDIRQFHAIDLGFNLLPEEMECEFYPAPYEDLKLPSNYVCVHPVQTWESRTWPREKWEQLIERLTKQGIYVVLLGHDSHERGFWDIEKPVFDIKQKGVINLLNKTNISQAWHVITNASKFITMDSGLLHVAGTTDTHIIQLGSSIHYKFRAPYRKGSQDYKYDYVGGPCDIFCASDMKYGVKEWGTIQGVPLLIGCLENKATFECHPAVDHVLSYFSDHEERSGAELSPEIVVTRDIKRVFVHLASNSLGDNLAWVPQVEEYRRVHECEVDVQIASRLVGLFESSYPLLHFIVKEDASGEDGERDSAKIAKKGYDAAFSVGCHKPNDMTMPVIRIATKYLGLPYQEIKPKTQLPPNLKNNFNKKYVCIATQSTAQCKYWNYPGGWKQTVDYLKTLGYDVVCIDRDACFGVEDHWNHTPDNAIRKNEFKGSGDPEIPLMDRINDIYFCDFFIGLSSGLSWLAWALNKPVIMIAGASAPRHEFYTPYRIINQDVCHSCFDDVDCMPFNRDEWMWCPRHKDTPRQFECSKKITFEMVKKQIDRLL
tara:strand:+ start:343 stop:2241 length:1899 start_codon:yes stop_codon:yes gene_type:complete